MADQREVWELREEVARLTKILNTPLFEDFVAAVKMEAAHQESNQAKLRDDLKEPEDWYWILGYLSGKALRAHLAGDREKSLHHTISSAALLLHWHKAILEQFGEGEGNG